MRGRGYAVLALAAGFAAITLATWLGDPVAAQTPTSGSDGGGGETIGYESSCTENQVAVSLSGVWSCDDQAGAAGGDSVSVDGVGVVDPDFDSGGDIDFIDTSNTVTANVKADSVALGTDTTGNYAGSSSEGGPATSIPSGAAPTADDPGELAHDTTANQLILDDAVVGEATRQDCAMIESLAAADDNLPTGFLAPAGGATITGAVCVCHGTCTTEAEITFEDGAGNGMTGTITCEDATTGDTLTAITSGGALVARESLVLSVSNTPSPDGSDDYSLCWEYTVGRQ